MMPLRKWPESVRNFAGKVQVRHLEQVRTERLKSLEREFMSPLQEIQESPPSAKKRLVLWALLLLFFIAIAWSWFSRINVVSTGTGRFIPDGRAKVVEVQQLSAVQSIHVETGQRVSAGSILVELDPTLQSAEIDSITRVVALNAARRERLLSSLAGRDASPGKDGQQALQRDLWRAEMDSYQSQRRIAETQIQEAQAELEANRVMIGQSAETLSLVGEQADNARTLAAIGAISRNDYLRLEQERIAQSIELESRKRQEKTLSARLAAAHQSLARLDAERRLKLLSQMEDLYSQSIGLDENRLKAEHRRQAYTLRAPVDGVVQAVKVATVGEVVAPGDEVVTIVPDEVPLIVEVQLSDRDAGFVEIGQPVEIKVEAFPFMQYGILPGRLVWVSPDAEVGPQGHFYKARIEPERLELQYQGKAVRVRPGMTVEVDVGTGQRRILEFFLGPLLKNVREGLSVR